MARPPNRGALWPAAGGLILAAMDAYAVVTLLPQMMTATGVSVDQPQAATPILTGFLVGYVVAMPLLGTYSDARGRLPAYAAAMIAFILGSTVTALSGSLAWLVAGRVLQGLGGGALVPLTLALAADLSSPGSRGPLVGMISALQEAGSAAGPLYGAALAAGPGGWRGVFWLNLPLGGLAIAGLWLSQRSTVPSSATTGRTPTSQAWGRPGIDWLGATLLGGGLGLAVLALYPDTSGARLFNRAALPLGLAALATLLAFAWHQARRLSPLIPVRLLRARPFWGGLAINVLAGGALMVALVDVPVLARGVLGLSTLDAGLLLSRLLVGLPVGAVLGGWMTERLGSRWTVGAGLALSAVAFFLMASWVVRQPIAPVSPASAQLLACGVGFGLLIAPLTIAVLDMAQREEHGLASSLVVLARTAGMVLALASLTAFGLAAFQHLLGQHPCTLPPEGNLSTRLRAFEACTRVALLQEYREIFRAAAGICTVGILAALLTLPGGRGRPRG
ncbi:MAG TPA: MFS transporter [Candidatus Dormibacteraeota bacterium]|nr:MFS transporter [Candidatus Dormibacteraeota bacterium]